MAMSTSPLRSDRRCFAGCDRCLIGLWSVPLLRSQHRSCEKQMIRALTMNISTCVQETQVLAYVPYATIFRQLMALLESSESLHPERRSRCQVSWHPPRKRDHLPRTAQSRFLRWLSWPSPCQASRQLRGPRCLPSVLWR